MMTVIEIADALVIALNDHVFSESFVAERAYRPTFELSDMQDLHVTVVPRAVEYATIGRSIPQGDMQIDIGVQKKIEADADTDGLMSLVDEIATFIRDNRSLGTSVWLRTTNDPVFSQEHLNELRQFTSVLTVTYRTAGA